MMSHSKKRNYLFIGMYNWISIYIKSDLYPCKVMRHMLLEIEKWKFLVRVIALIWVVKKPGKRIVRYDFTTIVWILKIVLLNVAVDLPAYGRACHHMTVWYIKEVSHLVTYELRTIKTSSNPDTRPAYTTRKNRRGSSVNRLFSHNSGNILISSFIQMNNIIVC